MCRIRFALHFRYWFKNNFLVIKWLLKLVRYLLLHSLKICQLFPQFCWMRKPKQRGDKVICLNQCSCSWLNIIMYKVQPFTDVCGEQVRPSENGSFSVCILSYQHHTTVTCFCVLKYLVFRTVTWLFLWLPYCLQQSSRTDMT